jgi:hypothetical protein
MTDVFFSYSSKDRERVRFIRDALVAEGFDVFWDQEVPPGRNWDEWIRQHLEAARCTIVFWSENSVRSGNVVHEATIAKDALRLIPVLLDPIGTEQFPMGHYTTMGVTLFEGADNAGNIRRLIEEVEAKATRRWMRRKLAVLEGQVKALTHAREQLEDHEAQLQRRVAELEAQAEAARRDRAKSQAALALAEKKISELENALAAREAPAAAPRRDRADADGQAVVPEPMMFSVSDQREKAQAEAPIPHQSDKQAEGASSLFKIFVFKRAYVIGFVLLFLFLAGQYVSRGANTSNPVPDISMFFFSYGLVSFAVAAYDSRNATLFLTGAGFFAAALLVKNAFSEGSSFLPLIGAMSSAILAFVSFIATEKEVETP